MDEYPQLGKITFGPPSPPRPVPVDPDAFKLEYWEIDHLKVYTNNVRASTWVAAVEAMTKQGFVCDGCGHLCRDPEKDLEWIRKAGGISCCPERKMRPLSEAIAPPEDLAPLIAARDARIREQALREAAANVVDRAKTRLDPLERDLLMESAEDILGLIKNG